MTRRRLSIPSSFLNKMHHPTGGDPNRIKKCPLPEGKVYIRHQGAQQRLRNLRKAAKPVLQLRDDETLLTLARLREFLGGEGLAAEFANLSVIVMGLNMSQEVQAPWADTMIVIMEKMEVEREENLKAKAEVPNE